MATPPVSIVAGDTTVRTFQPPIEGAPRIITQNVPPSTFRAGFSAVIGSGVDTNANNGFNVITTGSGQSINQGSSNLNIVGGTTANAETIVRSKQSFTGDMLARIAVLLSTRVANQQVFIELVDVLGDALAYTINSATSVTVTVPTAAFPAASIYQTVPTAFVGHSMFLGALSVSGSIPGRYTISAASISGSNFLLTFTVAGFPSSGSGTLSLFGWNYMHIIYDGTTATTAKYDTQRNGWNSLGDTAYNIVGTASPGHVALLSSTEGEGYFADQSTLSQTTQEINRRATRIQKAPDDVTTLYLQFRVVNGTTAPTANTLSIGFAQVGLTSRSNVTIAGIEPFAANGSIPIDGGNPNFVNVSLGSVVSGTTPNDGLANSVGVATADQLELFNGATWDRQRNNINTTTGDTGAKTATFNGATQTNYNARGAKITCIVSAVSGTSPTMTMQLQFSPDGGTTWINYGAATSALTAAGTLGIECYPAALADESSGTQAALVTGWTVGKLLSAPLPRIWRVMFTLGGTSPSFTITGVYVNYEL